MMGVHARIDLTGFSPTQRRMLEVLSDMDWHWAEELHNCLNDDLGPRRNISAHLSMIRRLLPSQGLTLTSDRPSRAEIRYRLTVLVSRDEVAANSKTGT